MLSRVTLNRRASLGDFVVIGLLIGIIYSLVVFGREWRAEFRPTFEISLSFSTLPYYSLLSAMRGLFAYVLSLLFTLIVGYWAAKSPTAEKLIIPILDVLQSIPVLGFLPGLVLALIAIFPKTSVGLELACVLMIFTGQVWNMTFSFYSSLKAVPTEYKEAVRVIRLNFFDTFIHLELPFSAMNLAWNSLMSMSGGWFFLSVCEAFTLGDQEYRLPGLGAYMATAIARGDRGAMIGGVIAMTGIILLLDFLIWRPILAWVQTYRLEAAPGIAPREPAMTHAVKTSRILRWVLLLMRTRELHKRLRNTGGAKHRWADRIEEFVERYRGRYHESRLLPHLLVALSLGALVFAVYRLTHVLFTVPLEGWRQVGWGAVWSLLRVLTCLALGSLWTVPAGIWIGTSPERMRIAQPIIQLFASFPAPMLYPIALTLFLGLGLPFRISAALLMLLGVQWYILFNVLAGAMRVPKELGYALELMGASRRDWWQKLYLPSVFPSLVTGWVTAAGGAWNASIVAEYVSYRGNVLTTPGLGAVISVAASEANFPLLAASLTVMVAVVIALNRLLWAPIYHLSQNRFRLDL
ncbi:MAG: ABC transporter permease subunit [Deltaproteobacteria bacterium]|nr:ABC transporter permease subunit [Deltaproteobacteria bacterium]MBI3294088.1 ABC transporter permease subunit [Deltaproteobacteria bacterium]